MEPLTFVAPDPASTEVLADMLGHAFGFPSTEAAEWFARSGPENLRVLKRADRVIGGLVEIPMGQFFGGRSVPMLGVAGVAIAPEERGRGLGARMMIEMLRGARSRGFALSTLYAASLTLYRKAGYERAGSLYEMSIDPRTIEVPRERDMTITEVAGTPETVTQLYRAEALHVPGSLDRGPYIWSRISKPRGLFTKTFVVQHANALEGYVVISHSMGGGFPTSVRVTDVVARTARAGRAILRLLAEYRSLAATVKWRDVPTSLFFNLIPERHITIALEEPFVTRVIDVASAFATRGWPRHAAGTLTFELDDASLPENSGKWMITIDRGRATATASTEAFNVKLTERALAALYTGHLSSRVLERLGWLEADDETHATLDSWFSGPAPAMFDFF